MTSNPSFIGEPYMGHEDNPQVRNLVKATAHAILLQLYHDIEHNLDSDALLGVYCSLTHLDSSLPKSSATGHRFFRAYNRKDHVAISFLASEDASAYVPDVAALTPDSGIDVNIVHKYLIENFEHCIDYYYRRPPVLVYNISKNSPVVALNTLCCVLNNTHLPTMLCHMTEVDRQHPDVKRWIACYERLHHLIGEDVKVPQVDMRPYLITNSKDGLICVPNNKLNNISISDDGKVVYTDQQVFEQPVTHEAYYLRSGTHGRWWYRP